MARGFDTPIVNALVFKKLQASLGGNLHIMLSGGAPLNTEIEEFFKLTMCPRLCTSLGMTENTGCVTLGDEHANQLGDVGTPNVCVDLKLENWEEGGYRVLIYRRSGSRIRTMCQ